MVLNSIRKKTLRTAAVALLSAAALAVTAQTAADTPENPAFGPGVTIAGFLPVDSAFFFQTPDTIVWTPDTVMAFDPLPQSISLPPVYTGYSYLPDEDPFAPELSGSTGMEWLDRQKALENRTSALWQRFMVNHPDMVKNNIAFMEAPPKKYYGTVNPADHTIEIKEIEPEMPEKLEVEVEKKHWIRTFSASLQFSQAYISPNWYQGGNNNLNFIADIFYNVKLNPEYHPKLLFETTMQYKLGINSAPDDSLRNYSISEDLLQINSTFGIKAAKHWYYSLTGQFKTQLLTSYGKNTRDIASAFLSPGELNLGLGMTYNYASANKKFTFDASISPLSYNMKVCIQPNDKLPHSTFGIDPDKKYVINIGSSGEAKLTWQITGNISYRTRVFIFTDYSNVEADWENTLAMSINKYLSTQIYVHARYDTGTPAIENVKWHKLQLKEILSFGVTYKFSTI